MKINREELAWAGGFFSGEGYTGLKTRNSTHWKRYPNIAISQAGDGEELHRFNNAIGNIGKIYGPYGPYGENTRCPLRQFRIGGFEKVQAIITMLWPFLSTAKQEQASKVLRIYLTQAAP